MATKKKKGKHMPPTNQTNPVNNQSVPSAPAGNNPAPTPAQATTPASSSSTPTPPSTHSPFGKLPNQGLLKKLLLVITAVFIILVLIFALTNHKAKKPTTPTTRSLAQVSLTTSGLLPQTISVKAGTTITWTNNDTKVHQVSADPFPKDDSIPGFNSTLILNPKDTYSFTFTKTGTYTYHDEKAPLNKAYEGTITVN